MLAFLEILASKKICIMETQILRTQFGNAVSSLIMANTTPNFVDAKVWKMFDFGGF